MDRVQVKFRKGNQVDFDTYVNRDRVKKVIDIYVYTETGETYYVLEGDSIQEDKED